MVNLRELHEEYLAVTLEGDYALPIVLIAPDGAEQTVNGQILYDRTGEDPDTGETVYVVEPVVTVRRSSLTRIPEPGEKWSVRIPNKPSLTADLETYLVADQAFRGGRSLGMLRLYCTSMEQSS